MAVTQPPLPEQVRLQKQASVLQAGGSLGTVGSTDGKSVLRSRCGTLLLLYGLHLVQGWHANKHVALDEQVRHVAVQEGQQQHADVGAVHVRIRQQNDLRAAPVRYVRGVPAARTHALSCLLNRAISSSQLRTTPICSDWWQQ